MHVKIYGTSKYYHCKLALQYKAIMYIILNTQTLFLMFGIVTLLPAVLVVFGIIAVLVVVGTIVICVEAPEKS